jgi:hypothetical protein
VQDGFERVTIGIGSALLEFSTKTTVDTCGRLPQNADQVAAEALDDRPDPWFPQW